MAEPGERRPHAPLAGPPRPPADDTNLAALISEWYRLARAKAVRRADPRRRPPEGPPLTPAGPA
jgi:hypothetical protein